jgi:hypothetical protein
MIIKGDRPSAQFFEVIIKIFIKDTTESVKSASYLDILLNIDSNGRLTTSLYDKRDDFGFAIVN